MRIPKRLPIAALFLAAPALAAAPRLPEPVASLQKTLLAGRGATDHATELATRVGPRSAGSEGDKRAVAWAEAKLRELGFENVRAEPVTVPHWERGESEGAILEPYRQHVALAALGGSVGTAEGGLEAEVVATENLASLAKLDPERIRGRIVYFGERMIRARDGGGYGKTVEIRSRGALEAQKLGAVAVLIRSVGTDSSRLPHTGATTQEPAPAAIPAAALSNADADLLEEMTKSGRPIRFRLRMSCRVLPDEPSANVIGEVRGREKPEEIVLLGAHLDSWDLGTGAQDDGTGVGLVIEAARAIAELRERPRRTIRVVLYANEEFGLSGGKAYAREHAAELALHQAALESDFGSGRVWRLRGRTDAAEARAVLAELAPLVAGLGVELDAVEAASGGADVSTIRKLGVPVFDLSHDGTNYFDVHHSADDTADKIVPHDLAQATAAFASIAWALAERPALLARTPPEPEKEE